MPEALRSTIRKVVAEKLKKHTRAKKVLASRFVHLDLEKERDSLPLITVYTREEKGGEKANGFIEKRLTLDIEGVVNTKDEDEIDSLIDECENIFELNEPLPWYKAEFDELIIGEDRFKGMYIGRFLLSFTIFYRREYPREEQEFLPEKVYINELPLN